MQPIRILLADDHDLVRAGIRMLLERILDVEVVGEANSGRGVIELVGTLRPDLVLMDVMMPDLNGLEATAQIVQQYPDVRVVMLSMNDTEEYVLQSLRAGAVGYLLKNISLTELEAAIRAVSSGKSYLCSAVSQRVIEGYRQRTTTQQPQHEQDSLARLTPRQLQVLKLLAEGNSAKQIANKLHVSVKTVESHRMHLMNQLGIRDIPGLVRYAIRKGIVSADQ